MIRKTLLAGAAIAGALLISPAYAAAIVNGGFEAQAGSIAAGGDLFTNPTGWNTDNLLISTGFWGTAVAPEGRIFAIVGNGADAGGVSLSQTVSGLTVGQTYAVTFELGGENWHVPGSVEKVDVSMLSGSSAGDVIFDAPTSSNICAVCGPGASVLWNNWSFFTYDFLATSTSATIQWQQTSDTTAFGDTGIDNVSLAPAIATPEPLTLSLFGAGLVGGIAMRRRKKRTG